MCVCIRMYMCVSVCVCMCMLCVVSVLETIRVGVACVYCVPVHELLLH